jgi:hypothetical protein
MYAAMAVSNCIPFMNVSLSREEGEKTELVC